MFNFSSKRIHQYHRINYINRLKNSMNYQICVTAASSAYQTQYLVNKRVILLMVHSHCKFKNCSISPNRRMINYRSWKTKQLKWAKNNLNSNRTIRMSKSKLQSIHYYILISNISFVFFSS